MRFIDLDRLLGHPAAQSAIQDANAALQALLAEQDPGEQKRLIDANRDIWVAFREHFEREFGAKCWYVECENPGSDDDIDHYRPKGRIAEAPDHGGYWWEALNWRNFRLSCHRANRLRVNPETEETGGKGDHFPLLIEADRWYGPNDPAGCCERPTLLDPTDPEDPNLLTFNPDGTVAVAAEYADDDDAQRRIADSRLYLHLEWPRFKEQRQQLYRRVLRQITRGDRAAERLSRGFNVDAKTALTDAARELLSMTPDKAPYSRAARAFIRIFSDRRWVRVMVLKNIGSDD